MRPQPVITHSPFVTIKISISPRITRLNEISPDSYIIIHNIKVLLVYSGPVSQRIALGFPFHSMSCSSTLTTRMAGIEKSTSMVSASRLKPEMTFSRRTESPAAHRSRRKSIDQYSLLHSGTASGSGLSLFSSFLGFIRMFSDNSQ